MPAEPHRPPTKPTGFNEAAGADPADASLADESSPGRNGASMRPRGQTPRMLAVERPHPVVNRLVLQ